MARDRSSVKVEDEKKSVKKYHAWHGLVAGLIMVAAVGAAVLVFSSKGSAVDTEVAAAAPVNNVAAEKLQGCKFLVNQEFKKKAKVYLCLFSASWCPPCRAEMPRIARTYAETLKADPDIELIHFSCDRDDGKAMAWAKEHDVQFPVVKPKGGNPLDLHTRGIPHLFSVKADGTLMEEGHPMKLFSEQKLSEVKQGSMRAQ